MAIALEYIDLVIPIAKIREKYPGGWKQCLRDHEQLFGARVWFDECLFRDGTMNSQDMRLLVERWAQLGFAPWESRNGSDVWLDMCVLESSASGPTMPCDWLVFDSDRRIAYLRGTEPGDVWGRDGVVGEK
jgi:hypothetical protein